MKTVTKAIILIIIIAIIIFMTSILLLVVRIDHERVATNSNIYRMYHRQRKQHNLKPSSSNNNNDKKKTEEKDWNYYSNLYLRRYKHRQLQPSVPSPPSQSPPNPPTVGQSNVEDVDYCDTLFIIFDVLAATQGYDCDCTSDDDVVTVHCEAEEPECDDTLVSLDSSYESESLLSLCHLDSFTSSTTKGDIDNGIFGGGYKSFSIEACAEYYYSSIQEEKDDIIFPLNNNNNKNDNINILDSLFDDKTTATRRKFCFVYQLSLLDDSGDYNLDECSLDLITTEHNDAIKSRRETLCTCSICFKTFGIITIWGLTLDCQDALLPNNGIKFVNCMALTDFNRPIVIPKIEEVHLGESIVKINSFETNVISNDNDIDSNDSNNGNDNDQSMETDNNTNEANTNNDNDIASNGNDNDDITDQSMETDKSRNDDSDDDDDDDDDDDGDDDYITDSNADHDGDDDDDIIDSSIETRTNPIINENAITYQDGGISHMVWKCSRGGFVGFVIVSVIIILIYID